MGHHGGLPPPPPDIVPETRTHPSPERCDSSPVEQARWRLTSASGGVITLCNYHYRKYEIGLAVGGWLAERIEEEDDQ